MTNLRVVRQATFKKSSWPNGAGTSWQIASEPAGSSAPDCEWQFATALIERPVPFSVLPDIDRLLTLVSGQSFHLSIEGRPPIDVQRFAPVAFPGDQPTYCHAGDGPSNVLNLLFRRGKFAAKISLREHGQTLAPPNVGETLLLFALSGRIALSARDESVELEEGDAGIIRHGFGAREPIKIGGNGSVVYCALLKQL